MLPPPYCTHTQKLEYSSDILDAMNALRAAGAVPKWGCESPESGAAGTTRQNKFNGELKMAGIKVSAGWRGDVVRESVRGRVTE